MNVHPRETRDNSVRHDGTPRLPRARGDSVLFVCRNARALYAHRPRCIPPIVVAVRPRLQGSLAISLVLLAFLFYFPPPPPPPLLHLLNGESNTNGRSESARRSSPGSSYTRTHTAPRIIGPDSRKLRGRPGRIAQVTSRERYTVALIFHPILRARGERRGIDFIALFYEPSARRALAKRSRSQFAARRNTCRR